MQKEGAVIINWLPYPEGRPCIPQETHRPIDHSKAANHFVRLTASAKSDMEWWHHFCASWNGTSMMFMVNRTKPECDMSIVSDASDS